MLVPYCSLKRFWDSFYYLDDLVTDAHAPIGNNWVPSAGDEPVSGIWGWESADARTNFVISGEYFERDPVSVRSIALADNGFLYAGTAFHGVFRTATAVSFVGESAELPEGARLSPGGIW